METLRVKTRRRGNGTEHSIEVTPTLQVRVVPSRVLEEVLRMDEQLRASFISTFSGRHFDVLKQQGSKGEVTILIRNQRSQCRANIHRDDAWQKRCELAAAFSHLLPGGAIHDDIDPIVLKHHLPIALLTPVYWEAFEHDSNE